MDSISTVIDGAVVGRLIDAHATNTVSVQLGAENLKYFIGPDGSGALGYQEYAGVAVVAGDPLCRPERTAALVEAFLASRAERGTKCLFVSASEAFARRAAALNCSAMKVGEEAVFDLDRYSLGGGSMKRLRYHEGRARRKGVEVRSVCPDDLSQALASDLDDLTAAWLGRRSVGPLGFLLAIRPLREPGKAGKRIYVAVRRGAPIAYLTAVPIPAARGTYLEDYVYAPDVPDGTIELLFHAACDDLRDRGCAYVTLGTAPLAGLTAEDFRHHPIVGWCLRTVFDRVSWPYPFRSLYAFKARFHPTRWVPKYLVYEQPFTPRAAAALLLAYLPAGALPGAGRLAAWRRRLARRPLNPGRVVRDVRNVCAS